MGWDGMGMGWDLTPMGIGILPFPLVWVASIVKTSIGMLMKGSGTSSDGIHWSNEGESCHGMS